MLSMPPAASPRRIASSPSKPASKRDIRAPENQIGMRHEPLHVLLRAVEIAGPQEYGNSPDQSDGQRYRMVDAPGLLNSERARRVD